MIYPKNLQLKTRFPSLLSDMLQKAFGVGLITAGTLHECWNLLMNIVVIVRPSIQH